MLQQKTSPARIFLLLSIIISVSAVLGILLVAGKIGEKNRSVVVSPVSDEKCGQKVKFSGNCEMASIGFEFDANSGRCIKKNGSCRVETPFKNLEECQNICETKTETKSAVVGEDFLITLDANPSTGYSWQADFDNNYLTLRSKDFVPGKVSPETVGAGGKEVFTFAPLKAGEVMITMNYGRTWESKPIETKVFKYDIKESKEVTISTDKVEYEQGEIVKAVISKIDNLIYVDFNTGIDFYYLNGNSWEKIQKNCTNNCGMVCENDILKKGSCYQPSMPLYLYQEYNGPWELQWNQQECISERKLCGDKTYDEGSTKQIPYGKFKAEFCYYNKEDVDLREAPGYIMPNSKKCVENEFTIKEKTAIDARCGQKVRITGQCDAIISGLGYEFDSTEGKCVKKSIDGSGCRVETPFNSLEECQKTCEAGAVSENELKFETIEKGVASPISEAKNYMIKNNSEWKDLLGKIDYSMRVPTEVDFTKDMVVAAFQGSKPTGGFNIEIKKITEQENAIEVSILETSPGRGCMVTDAFTSPYHIVKVQKSDKEVVFRTEKAVNNCK